MRCRISNILALAINYDTQLVSGLFEMRDSGGFPTFPLRLSFSISDFGRPCLYKSPCCFSFFSVISLSYIIVFFFTC